MIHANHRGHAVRIAALALAVSWLGAAALAQTNAPATNAPPPKPSGGADTGRAGGAPPPAAQPTPPPAASQAAPPAGAAGGGPAPACPATAQAIQQPTDCTCTGAAMEAEGPVWGTDIYTDNSSICRAARHAGVIPGNGGSVRVTPRGPQQSYAGAARNGVTSESYASYERSFSVAASGSEQGRAAAAPPATPAAPPAAAPPAAAASGGPVAACPTTAQGMQQPTDCVCTGLAAQAEAAAVWGTDVYTDDSSICRAARHAGILGENGGPVRVTPRGGQQSYAGATRNGVTTQNYGVYERSFSVAASEVKSDIDVNQCPANFQGYRGSSQVVSCTCSAAQAGGGTVWGTDAYTDDSSICRAAVHAGIIPQAGGAVRLRVVPGRQSYPGSQRNGVQTQDYGAWEGAFGFEK